MYGSEKRIYRSAIDPKHKVTATIRVDREDVSADQIKQEIDDIFAMVRAGFDYVILFDPDRIGGANDGS